MTHEAIDVEDLGGRRRLSLGQIIAIVIVMMIIITGMFLLFYNPDVKEVTIITPEDVDTDNDGTYDSIRFVLVAVKNGMRDIDEDAELVITHGAQKVFIGSIRVKSEESAHDVRYDSFVIENGKYDLTVSIGSVRSSASYVAAFVPTILNASIEEIFDKETGDYYNVVQVTPIYINDLNYSKGFWIDNYEDAFFITTVIVDPAGERTETTMSMGELPGNYSERFELIGGLMGEYSVIVKLENRLVKSSSMYRSLEAEGGGITKYVNRAPAITELRSTTSRPRVDQELEISIKAVDRDSNGGLTVFFVDWGEDGDLLQINVSGLSQSIRVKHTYTIAGPYVITVSVADNGPYYPNRPQDSFVRYAAMELDVQVYFI